MSMTMLLHRRFIAAIAAAAVWSCASEREVRVASPAAEPVASERPRSGGAGCSDDDLRRSARQVLRGSASFYASSLAGNLTASGARYDPQSYSAAHRSLPFGTRLRVTRTDLERPPVCVVVNDRGPFAGKNRILDLSRRAAEGLDMIEKGVVPIRIEVL